MTSSKDDDFEDDTPSSPVPPRVYPTVFSDDDDDDDFEESAAESARQRLQRALAAIAEEEAKDRREGSRKVAATYNKERARSMETLDDSVGNFHRMCKDGKIYPKMTVEERPIPTATLIRDLQNLVFHVLRANAPTAEDFLSSCERFNTGFGHTYSNMEERYRAASEADKRDTKTEVATDQAYAAYVAAIDGDKKFVVSDDEEEEGDDDSGNYTPSGSDSDSRYSSEEEEEEGSQPKKRRRH